jgi:hypothetical protein
MNRRKYLIKQLITLRSAIQKEYSEEGMTPRVSQMGLLVDDIVDELDVLEDELGFDDHCNSDMTD